MSSLPPHQRPRRVGLTLFARRTGAVLLAGVCVGASILAAMPAVRNVGGQPGADDKPVPGVVTWAVVLQDAYTVSTVFSGRIEAPREVALSFEQAGRIDAVLVEEGDRVAAGAAIARLDTRTLKADEAARLAERAVIEADLGLARRTLDRQRRLGAANAVAEARIDEARFAVQRLEAQIAQIDATLAGIRVALDKALLRAPFAGLIGTRTTDPGAQAAPGQPVAVLYEGGALRFRAGLTEDAAAAVAAGAAYTLEVAGSRRQARLTAVRRDVDPATRTVPMLFALEDDGVVPLGAVGTVTLAQQVVGRGAWVPLSSLVEGLRGGWVVMVAAAGGSVTVVEAVPVEVLHVERDRVFLRGAFGTGDRVVADGTHRLTAGQRVRIVE